MRVRDLLIILSGLAAAPITAQLPRRVIDAAVVTTVSAEQLDVVGIVAGAVTPAGELVIGDPNDLMVVVVTPNGVIHRFGRSGEGPGEFRNIRDVGVAGGTIWIADSRLMRLTGFDLNGKVVETIPYDWQVKLGDVTTITVRPFAVTKDHAILFHAGVGSSTRDTVPAGSDGAVVRWPDAGSVHELGWATRGGRCSRILDGGVNFVRPFCVEASVEGAANGRGILILEPVDAPDHATAFTATLVRTDDASHGTTTVSYPTRRLTHADWDSVVARGARRAARSPQLAVAMNALPRDGTFPAFGASVLLDDLVGLVRIYPVDRSAAQWLAIDATGAIGRLRLAPGERPLAGTSEMLWVSTQDADGLLGVRLYRLSQTQNQ